MTACSSTHPGRDLRARHPAPPAASSLTTELSVAFNSAPPGNWNPLSAGATGDAVTAVVDQVFPSVYTFGPSFNPILNTTLVDSVTETSTSPQVLVYRINPKAVWSDGVPITGGDFVYNWKAQAGVGSDVGGRPFTPADRSGYDLIQSLTASPSSPDELTVTFSSPYPDWTSLFRHLIPAHVAASVGFDSGFTDPVTDLVSGGPYLVTEYSPSGFLRLVRNPSFWGSPATTLELDFRFLPDVQQISNSLLAGQLSCAQVPATASVLDGLRVSKGLSVMVAPGSQYLDLEFRQSQGVFTDKAVRAAITSAVNRPVVIQASVGAADPGDPPLANRFMVAGEIGYASHAPTPVSGQGSHPVVGPLRLAVDQTDVRASAAAQAIVQQLTGAGFSVSLGPFGGPWDLAVRERTLSPFPGDGAATYLTGSSTNADGVSDPALDALVDAAAAAQDGQRLSLIDQVDQEAWSDVVDLPLFALPVAVVCQTNVDGIGPNPSPDGIAYDAPSWGLLAAAP